MSKYPRIRPGESFAVVFYEESGQQVCAIANPDIALSGYGQTVNDAARDLMDGLTFAYQFLQQSSECGTYSPSVRVLQSFLRKTFVT